MLTIEQLRQRKQGIGGSDVAPIAGFSNWKTALDVYLDKISDEIPEQSKSESIYFGNVLEDVVAREYAKRNTKTIEEQGEYFTHPVYSWMFANIDRRILNDGGILECKTASAFNSDEWGEEGTDDIPAPYLFQIAHYRIVLDAPYVDLAVLIGGQMYKQYHYEKNSVLEDKIINLEHNFWHKHVLKNVPPEPVNYSEVLKLYSDNNKIIVAPPAALPVLSQLRQVKKQKAEIEQLEDDLKKDICNLMEGANTLIDIDGTVLATWKATETARLSQKKFKEEQPEMFSKYVNVTSTRRFLVKNTGE